MALDYNAYYGPTDKRDLVDDPDATFQFIERAIYFRACEIYYGIGDAIDIQSKVFEFMSDQINSNLVLTINTILTGLKPDLVMDLDNSMIQKISGNEILIDLTFYSSGQKRRLYRRIYA